MDDYNTLFCLMDQGEFSVAMDLCEQEGYSLPLSVVGPKHLVFCSSTVFGRYQASFGEADSYGTWTLAVMHWSGSYIDIPLHDEYSAWNRPRI